MFGKFEYLLYIVLLRIILHILYGLPRRLNSKESSYNAGDAGLTPEMGRSPGEENGYPLLYSCLGNSTDRIAWQATVSGVGLCK